MYETLYAAKMQNDCLKIYLYDDIVSDSVDWWTGEEIKSETSAKYIKELLEENPNARNIEVYINSNGGDVKEGLAIYNQLVRHKAFVTVYVDGFACSIASVIAMAGDKIIMGQNTLMMIHHASCGAYGTPNELRKIADDLEVIDSTVVSSYRIKAGELLSPEKLTELLDSSTWLNAETCLSLGLCDEIKQLKDPMIEAAEQRLSKTREEMKQQAKDSIMQKLQKIIS